MADGRVNRSLNLSRALGDMEYKQSKDLPPEAQAVTAMPELKQTKLQPNDEFLILACDGIWDRLSNQEVSAMTTSCDCYKAAQDKTTTEGDLAQTCPSTCPQWVVWTCMLCTVWLGRLHMWQSII